MSDILPLRGHGRIQGWVRRRAQGAPRAWQVSERLGREKRRISESALARLARHRWPGNVRELRNFVEAALALGAHEVIAYRDVDLAGVLGDAGDLALPNTSLSAMRAALEPHLTGG